MNEKPNLTEQELANDALNTEKQLLNSYGIFLAESTCQNLRNELSQIITENQQVQFEIFNAMKAKGWYQIKNVPMQEMTDAVNKFQQVKTTMM